MPSRTPTALTKPQPPNATASRARARVTLRRKTTCGAALAANIRAAHNNLIAARLVVLETNDPAGPHHLRVSIRRLRSTLRAFQPLADSATLRKLDAHAKAIADAVAPLREADVLLHDTCNISGIERDAAFVPLRQALVAYREGQSRAARAALKSKRWASLQLYLSLAATAAGELPALRRPLAAFADKAIERRWRKASLAGTGFEHQTTDERHAFRLHLKKLRYTIDVFKPLYASRRATSEQIRSFQVRLKALQDTFGYLNDVAQAARLTEIVTQATSNDGAALRLVGHIQGWHAAHAEREWKGARDQWKRLRKAPRFWR